VLYDLKVVFGVGVEIRMFLGYVMDCMGFGF
jgi:hypothetical protein